MKILVSEINYHFLINAGYPSEMLEVIEPLSSTKTKKRTKHKHYMKFQGLNSKKSDS